MNSYARQQNAAYHSLAENMATPEQRLASLEAENARLKARIEVLSSELRTVLSKEQKHGHGGSHSALSTQHSALSSFRWLTPGEFAALQGISQSTLSRALNGKSGNRVMGKVMHRPNGHWLISDRATFSRQRKGKRP